MEKEKIINTIRNLFARANKDKNPYEEEINSSLKLAKELMTKNNLSLSEIEIKESSDDDVKKIYSKETGKMRFWQKFLASKIIAPIFEVEAIYSRAQYSTFCYIFVGYKDDPILAKEAYEYLVDYIKKLGKTKEQNRKRRTSYYEGLIDRLTEKAKEEVYLNNLSKSQQVHCKALIIIKEEKINKWLNENMKTKTMNFKFTSRKDFYENSYNKGRKDADNIDLRNRKKIQ